jgi:hypothetical protein
LRLEDRPTFKVAYLEALFELRSRHREGGSE